MLRYPSKAAEARALGVGTGSAGGYMVPQEFSRTLESALKAYDPLFSADVCTQIETDRGGSMPIPIVDDGTGAASVVAENNQVAQADIVFAQATMPNASKWTSPIICVSRELVQDTAFDLQGYLAAAIAVRMSRGIGVQIVSDIIANTSQGVQLPTGNTTTLTFDGLVDLIGSVDPLYIQSPKCVFAMRFPTLVALHKLKASTGGSQMIDFDAGPGPISMFSKRIVVSPSVPGLAASAKTILFGDFGRVVLRVVQNSVAIRPFFERFAEIGQVGYSAYMRVSYVVLKPSSSPDPIRWLQQSAT
jgi:HK97 family phage major capsid protein